MGRWTIVRRQRSRRERSGGRNCGGGPGLGRTSTTSPYERGISVSALLLAVIMLDDLDELLV